MQFVCSIFPSVVFPQLSTIARFQQEQKLDKDIINTMQEKFCTLTENYTQELLRSEEDKAALDRQLEEIEASRGLTSQLQTQVRELRSQQGDQERLRSELINKFATDRAEWEIHRADLHSQLNQVCISECELSKNVYEFAGIPYEQRGSAYNTNKIVHLGKLPIIRSKSAFLPFILYRYSLHDTHRAP